ncbi:hypothetical protein [Streptomyces tendae]
MELISQMTILALALMVLVDSARLRRLQQRVERLERDRQPHA